MLEGLYARMQNILKINVVVNSNSDQKRRNQNPSLNNSHSQVDRCPPRPTFAYSPG